MTLELNGIKYIKLGERVSMDKVDLFKEKLKRHKCILRGITEVTMSGPLDDSDVKYLILVPEENIIDYNNEEI